MSDPATHAESEGLLLVGHPQDEALRRFAETCIAAGWRVERAPDVYRAMARLALAETGEYSRVVLGGSPAGRAEREFADLAPRYFDGLIVSALGDHAGGGGLDARAQMPARIAPQEIHRGAIESRTEAAAFRTPDVPLPRSEPPAARIAAPPINPEINDAESEPEPEAAPAHLEWRSNEHAQPAASASDAAAKKPSLHDAVRLRMRASRGPEAPPAPRVQRIPPGVTPPASAPPVLDASTNNDPPVLSREELEALLGPSRGAAGAGP